MNNLTSFVCTEIRQNIGRKCDNITIKFFLISVPTTDDVLMLQLTQNVPLHIAHSSLLLTVLRSNFANIYGS